jgi:hypothetical protein
MNDELQDKKNPPFVLQMFLPNSVNADTQLGAESECADKKFTIFNLCGLPWTQFLGKNATLQ